MAEEDSTNVMEQEQLEELLHRTRHDEAPHPPIESSDKPALDDQMMRPTAPYQVLPFPSKKSKLRSRIFWILLGCGTLAAAVFGAAHFKARRAPVALPPAAVSSVAKPAPAIEAPVAKPAPEAPVAKPAAAIEEPAPTPAPAHAPTHAEASEEKPVSSHHHRSKSSTRGATHRN
jgi:hypothetical protein